MVLLYYGGQGSFSDAVKCFPRLRRKTEPPGSSRECRLEQGGKNDGGGETFVVHVH